jgi:hypothetical protein
MEELDHLNINEAFVYPDYKHANEDVRPKIRQLTAMDRLEAEGGNPEPAVSTGTTAT